MHHIYKSHIEKTIAALDKVIIAEQNAAMKKDKFIIRLLISIGVGIAAALIYTLV